MEQPTPSAAGPGPDGSPADVPPGIQVTCVRDGETARIEVVGELTDTARRPLVREVTDLLLDKTPLKRIQLDLSRVSFLNSAGITALVQVQKMLQPRGIELLVVVEDAAVVRPLQLSGLWRRFTIVDRRPDHPPQTHEPLRPGTEHS
jgi:anti-anti-sigma factor